MAVDTVLEDLKKMSKPVTTPEEIAQVCNTIIYTSILPVVAIIMRHDSLIQILFYFHNLKAYKTIFPPYCLRHSCQSYLLLNTDYFYTNMFVMCNFCYKQT